MKFAMGIKRKKTNREYPEMVEIQIRGMVGNVHD